jgi:predicted nucleic acid-binding protein
VRFWDSSAVVPLLVSETATEAVTAEFGRDPEMLVWWLAEVECMSAIARIEREGGLSPKAVSTAQARLAEAVAAWQEIQPVGRVRVVAIRLLRTHPLRAADALQLAAALVAAEDDPGSLPFITLDERLRAAADREGFRAIVPA